MLLVFPPIAKACEPPAGIARLAAALHVHGIPCRVLDANLECQLWLMEQPLSVDDTWSRRAAKNLSRNLAALRAGEIYSSPDRYGRAVRDVNRVLAVAAAASGAKAGLADYQHTRLSPLRSDDLLSAAEHPERDPFYNWFSERLPALLHNSATESVRTAGFSLNYLSQALCTFAMIGYLRKKFPKIRIVLGGGLVTSWLQRPGWHDPFRGLVDQMVAGPGEQPLLSLFGVEGRPVSHVTPDYSLLPQHEYLSPGFILPYSSAGGCYWNRCSFCPERTEGNRYQPLPVQLALDDLHGLTARTNPALIHILDNAASPALMRALVADPPQAPWYGFARFERELADPDFCLALKHSGCVMLKLGLESGDQGVLDRLCKGIDIGQASRILMNLQRAGIAVYLYLLFGTPAETLAEARQTLKFVVRHRDAISFLNLAIFNMPVAGDEAAVHQTEPFYEGDLSLYTAFRHPHGWDRKKVRQFLSGEFKRDPAVAKIVNNDPPFFSSNHAPFFAIHRRI